MRSSRYLVAFWILCIVAGSIFGYGIYHKKRLDKVPETEPISREEPSATMTPIEPSDSLPGENVAITSIVPTCQPLAKPTEFPTVSPTVAPTRMPMTAVTLPATPTATATPTVTALPKLTGTPTATPTIIVKPTAVARATATPIAVPTETISDEEETISYPARIFGQTPQVDRSDSYVTYFEFSMDLIRILEPEIEAKNKNITVLLTRFVLRALFCGIDIKSIQINEPIPREQAALAVYLAAEIMGKSGTDTTEASAEFYVTDIKKCSSMEKKAIAYLYEQGIEEGYQISGQKFYPEKSLEEEASAAWILRLQQKWE